MSITATRISRATTLWNRVVGCRPRPHTLCIREEKDVVTKIQRWGNSLGLRIPRSLAEEAGLVAGSEVGFSIRDGGLVVTPARRRMYRLEDLLRRVTPTNRHAEVATGDPVGREVWSCTRSRQCLDLV